MWMETITYKSGQVKYKFFERYKCPYTGNRKEIFHMELLSNFLISVLAGIINYFINNSFSVLPFGTFQAQ